MLFLVINELFFSFLFFFAEILSVYSFVSLFLRQSPIVKVDEERLAFGFNLSNHLLGKKINRSSLRAPSTHFATIKGAFFLPLDTFIKKKVQENH